MDDGFALLQNSAFSYSADYERRALTGAVKTGMSNDGTPVYKPVGYKNPLVETGHLRYASSPQTEHYVVTATDFSPVNHPLNGHLNVPWAIWSDESRQIRRTSDNIDIVAEGFAMLHRVHNDRELPLFSTHRFIERWLHAPYPIRWDYVGADGKPWDADPVREVEKDADGFAFVQPDDVVLKGSAGRGTTAIYWRLGRTHGWKPYVITFADRVPPTSGQRTVLHLSHWTRFDYHTGVWLPLHLDVEYFNFKDALVSTQALKIDPSTVAFGGRADARLLQMPKLNGSEPVSRESEPRPSRSTAITQGMMIQEIEQNNNPLVFGGVMLALFAGVTISVLWSRRGGRKSASVRR